MGGYIGNFAVYTMAMIGLIFFALMVYKKCAFNGNSISAKTKTLKIEETISIAPRKTLYVVKAGDERFLIAGDVDKTTLISKLSDLTDITETKIDKSITEVETKNETQNVVNVEQTTDKENNKIDITQAKKELLNGSNKSFIKFISRVKEEEPIEIVEAEPKNINKSVDDLPVIVDFSKKSKNKTVLHNMIKKINE